MCIFIWHNFTEQTVTMGFNMYDTLSQTCHTLKKLSNKKYSIMFWSANTGIIRAQKLGKIWNKFILNYVLQKIELEFQLMWIYFQNYN
jgi:hypothetical protein